MDATEEKELAEEFEIGGFPTLKLFVNGDRKEPTDYKGTHTKTHTFLKIVKLFLDIMYKSAP